MHPQYVPLGVHNSLQIGKAFRVNYLCRKLLGDGNGNSGV